MLKISDAGHVFFLGTAIGLIGALGFLPPSDKHDTPLGVLLGQHQYAVHCLAFAPDGKTLATAGGYRDVRGEIKLWDVLTCTERTTLRGNQNGICAMAFAPDGKTLATVSVGQVATLWDLATGRERASVPVSVPSSLPTVLAPDGRTLALAGYGGDPRNVRLWRVNRGLAPGLAVASGPVAFSADRRTFALWHLVPAPQCSGAGPGESQSLIRSEPGSNSSYTELPAAQIWNLPLGNETCTLRADPYYVRALAFSPDGRILASGGFDDTVRLWDVESGQERAMLRGHTDQVGALAFAPQGNLLASGSHDSSVRLWDAATGEELAAFRGHTGTVTCVAFDAGGKWIASGSHDQTVRLWPVARGLP
jgi:WD40 repeat protein